MHRGIIFFYRIPQDSSKDKVHRSQKSPKTASAIQVLSSPQAKGRKCELLSQTGSVALRLKTSAFLSENNLNCPRLSIRVWLMQAENVWISCQRFHLWHNTDIINSCPLNRFVAAKTHSSWFAHPRFASQMADFLLQSEPVKQMSPCISNTIMQHVPLLTCRQVSSPFHAHQQ